MEKLQQQVESLVDRIENNNRWRQQQCFNLIPSEMTPSLLVKMCEISDPASRYAEHRTIKGKKIYFYQGIDFIRDIEDEARKEICRFFECSHAELRPISGQMANEIVFQALLKMINRDKTGPFRRLRAVMNNELNYGGHISSQPMGALFNQVEMNPESHTERVFPIPALPHNPYKADAERLIEKIAQYRPELIIFGKSMFLYPEPVKEVAEFSSQLDYPMLIMFDMAHVLGLYGAFQSPLQEGAHIVTGSTHKTFYGTQRGAIVGRETGEWEKLWPEIENRSCPGSTSNHHLGTLLGLLMATYEINAYRTTYQSRVQQNARAFAGYLHDAGIDVEGDPEDGYTQTHQVVVRVSQYGSGEEIARRLEKNNIIVNYQALPDDKTFLRSSGIRMGVQEMTRFGMTEEDFQSLAELISAVIQKDKQVGDEVKKYRERFLEMKYVLAYQKALPLAARILQSILPNGDYARSFADNLLKLAS
ncbi:hypothetical protein ACFL7M_15185 [Thermodesulfobacteriota bacterium]